MSPSKSLSTVLLKRLIVVNQIVCNFTSKSSKMFRNLGFPDNLMGNYLTPFERKLSCYSVSYMYGSNRPDVEDGGKIILPPSALEELTRRHIQYPMLFKLTNPAANKSTHCGVLEFVADEGKAYIPYWIMSNLLLDEGNRIKVENVSLETATFVKLQPQSVDFLDISNPKAVLEKALRLFACLTVGDVVAINYNDKRYELSVLKLKPANAVSIIECDMNVDFAAPVGYKEPEPEPRSTQMEEDDDQIDYEAMRSVQQAGFKAFSCQGVRLDGKTKDLSPQADSNTSTPHQRGVPNYDYKIGKINFIRNGRPKAEETKEETTFTPFHGSGNKLSNKKQRK